MDGETVVSFVLGVVVGLAIGCGFGGDWMSSAIRTPTVAITTKNGVAKVTVNGVEIDRQRAEALRDIYERLLSEWPKESTDGR